MMRNLMILAAVLACLFNGLARCEAMTSLDSLGHVVSQKFDSVDAGFGKVQEHLRRLSDSTWRAAVRSDEGSRIWMTMIIPAVGLVMGAFSLLMGFAYWAASKHLDEARQVTQEARERIESVEEHLKAILQDTASSAEYFFVLFNSLVPDNRKPHPQMLQDVLHLASFNLNERFVAINNLKAKGDESVLPFLEWVQLNRPDSSTAAQDAIDYIRARAHPSAATTASIPEAPQPVD